MDTQLIETAKDVLNKQPFSKYLGAELECFENGKAVLALNIRQELLQQNGFVHGGVISYMVDNSITFAAGSVLGIQVLTVEFKVNFIKPARGSRLTATAIVEGSTSRLAVCKCEVRSLHGGKESVCAVGQGTVSLVR